MDKELHEGWHYMKDGITWREERSKT